MGKYNDDSYRVGKGKPPREHRWKPDQSGNPKGRPKRPIGGEGLSAQLRRVGEQMIPVTLNGRTTRMSYFDALAQATMSGLLKAPELHKLRALELFERLGLLAAATERQPPDAEARRKFIERLAQAAREEGEEV